MSSIRRFGLDTFFFSVIMILSFAFATKLITLVLNGNALHNANPLLHMSERAVLILASTIECLVMAGIFIIRSSLGRSWIALWMCGVFFAYRLALLAYPHTTCSCFGRLSDWIGVEDSSLERIQLGALIYIFLGAALALWIERNVGRAQPAPAAKSHPTE